MARYRNCTADTLLDHITQQVVEPDGVLDVDDSLAEHYEDAVAWDPIPDVPSTATPAFSADDTETQEV